MVHFWKPEKHAFRLPCGCQDCFSMLPGHALSSIIVWNAGDGPRWAATAVKKQGYAFSCLTTNPTRPDDFVASILNTMISCKEELCHFRPCHRHVLKLLFYTAHHKIQLCNPCILPKALFFRISLPKGGRKLDFYPIPPDFRPQYYC